MYSITIRSSQGGEQRTLTASGQVLTLQPGDGLDCVTKALAMTSLVREGDALTVTMGDSFDVTISNFFAIDGVSLSFSDLTLTPDNIQAYLPLHVYVQHTDDVERYIEAAPGSTIHVRSGDRFEFTNTEVGPDDLHRVMDDFQVQFHLQGSDKKQYLTLKNFFDNHFALTPTLILADPEHHATDVFVNPNEEELRMHGIPTTYAVAGMLYTFYFQIDHYNPKTS
ncbi:MAG: hypothetical protein KDH94_07400, partial [Coxiellaceae bacterium]|nr:hypothetical protein [Coxiellaceae bacterium]